MPKGWEEIPCGEGKAIWTVFSASDYDGVGNDAAVCMRVGGWVDGWMAMDGWMGVECNFFGGGSNCEAVGNYVCVSVYV